MLASLPSPPKKKNRPVVAMLDFPPLHLVFVDIVNVVRQ